MKKNTFRNYDFRKLKDLEFDSILSDLAITIMDNKRTAKIVMPHVAKLDDKEGVMFVKILAGLLMLDSDGDREKIAKATLGKEADFMLMMAKEIDKVIDEDLKKFYEA